LERQAIAAAMAATGGNKLAASRLLGISRATLYDRLVNPV
jgi:transcriptional regulator of acetoin/glycerol metabolism